MNEMAKREGRRPTVAVLSILLVAGLGVGSVSIAGDEDEQVTKRRVVREVIKVPGDSTAEAVIVWVEEEAQDAEAAEIHIKGATRLMLDRARGYLGVRYVPLNLELLQHFEVPHDHGVMISVVEPESPAERSGFIVGDVVTAVDGLPLDADNALLREISTRDDGARVEIEIWREGRASTLAPVLETRSRPQLDVGELVLTGVDGGRQTLFSGFDPVVIGRAQRRLNEFVADPQFVTQIAGACGDREELQERLVEVEAKLREMEMRLREALAAVEN